MKKILYFFLLSFIFTSCRSSFSLTEQKLLSESPDSAARVLKITNKQDSLVLRTPSRSVKNVKKNTYLPLLVKKLYFTMLSENGVGIAAPQIGINKKVFLFYRLDQKDKTIEVAINPKIIARSQEVVCFQNDGCLSVPDKYGNSKRYSWIEVKYIDKNGEKVKHKFYGGSRSEDYTGIIFQHEFDHINGKLYIDKSCD